MNERPLVQHNVYAWLSVLAAKLNEQAVGRGFRETAKNCPIPFAVIDLQQQKISYVSDGFAHLLEIDSTVVSWDGLRELTGSDRHGREVSGLLNGRVMDAYQVRRPFQTRSGKSIEAFNWVVTCESDLRRFALWVLLPTAEGPERARIEPVSDEWPEDTAGVTLGRVGVDWSIQSVDPGVTLILGHRPETLVGRSLLEMIHRSDLPLAMRLAARAVSDRIGVGSVVRIRRSNSEWQRARLIFSPIAGNRRALGFALSRVESSDNEAPARVAELERRLWNIAQEIESAGIAIGFHQIKEVPEGIELRDLSPRQWEILNRLVQGERVPQIAEHLYISQNTVRNHLSAIYQKLGVKSQASLIQLLRAAPESHNRA